MSKFILPKKHISWSQLDLWMKNPARYRREYFENGKRLDTKYLQFGKGIAKMVEDLCELQKSLGSKDLALAEMAKIHNLDENTIDALGKLDTEGISEYDIKLEIRGVPILSYIDKYKPEDNTFREYKTGKNAWTPALVQKHGQLLFYATALKAKTGHMPWYCDLDWLETSDTPVDTDDFWAQADKKLALTGKVKSFRRNFDEREIERMEDLIEKVASEISEAYKLFIKEI